MQPVGKVESVQLLLCAGLQILSKIHESQPEVRGKKAQPLGVGLGFRRGLAEIGKRFPGLPRSGARRDGDGQNGGDLPCRQLLHHGEHIRFGAAAGPCREDVVDAPHQHGAVRGPRDHVSVQPRQHSACGIAADARVDPLVSRQLRQEADPAHFSANAVSLGQTVAQTDKLHGLLLAFFPVPQQAQ